MFFGFYNFVAIADSESELKDRWHARVKAIYPWKERVGWLKRNWTLLTLLIFNQTAYAGVDSIRRESEKIHIYSCKLSIHVCFVFSFIILIATYFLMQPNCSRKSSCKFLIKKHNNGVALRKLIKSERNICGRTNIDIFDKSCDIAGTQEKCWPYLGYHRIFIQVELPGLGMRVQRNVKHLSISEIILRLNINRA